MDKILIKVLKMKILEIDIIMLYVVLYLFIGITLLLHVVEYMSIHLM